MKERFKPSTDERPIMIVLGILGFYFLISGFLLYLFALHRISISAMIITVTVFTIIYIPRFLIIKKIHNKDEIKIIDDFIMINGIGINLADICKFNVKDYKPKVVFFMNNKMIVFNESEFRLLTSKEEIRFIAQGSEKIQLLKEFLTITIKK